jgi:Chaperone of endosialidase
MFLTSLRKFSQTRRVKRISNQAENHFPARFFAPSRPAHKINSAGKKKGRTMNPLIQLRKATPVFLVALACFGLSPAAQAVVPPPDGGYANQNTAEGKDALFSLTSGENNTALGFQALYNVTTTFENTAVGSQALLSNTVGTRNVAVGAQALWQLTNGDSNIAVGGGSLAHSESGNFNTALGRRALSRTLGDQNTGLGFYAGSNNDGGTNNIYIGNVGPVPIGTESNTIRLGTQTATLATIGNPPVESHPMPAHTATFIAGISGRPVVGNTVVVNANGKLGTATSSERFKKDIKPMDKVSEAILALKPVTFRYKKEMDADGTPQFGLVAEEVEKVNPDLVVRDTKGKPYTVRYEAVNAMLLNEFLKERRKVEQLESTIASLAATVKEQAAQIQKVSAQLALSKTAPQVANNP